MEGSTDNWYLDSEMKMDDRDIYRKYWYFRKIVTNGMKFET